MTTLSSSIDEIIARLKNLFIEVPGTHLSLDEISRLAGVEQVRCEPILDALVSAGFLTRSRDGRFRRPSA